MDRLINYFNNHIENITLVYSTPGIYLDAIISQNLSYPVKFDDMFPYADQKNEYWSGYFTSRANSKGQVRDGQRNLHASSKLFAMRMLNQDATFQDVNETLSAQYSMLDSMGIYQHHDAVTGTAMTHVAQDYNMRLYNSMKFASNPVYAKTLQDVLLSQ